MLLELAYIRLRRRRSAVTAARGHGFV